MAGFIMLSRCELRGPRLIKTVAAWVSDARERCDFYPALHYSCFFWRASESMGNHDSECRGRGPRRLSRRLRCGRRRFERSRTMRPLFSKSVLRRMQVYSWRSARRRERKDRLDARGGGWRSGPWRQQAILGRGDWDADALRDIVHDYVIEHWR